MKTSVTVYCGSSAGKNENFIRQARRVGELLADAGCEVITGAGAAGMMRAVADGALSAGGTVHGIIPQFMVDRGWQYDALSRMTITETMHARKELMASLSSAAIALPGGVGTWEEFMEIVTWKQLGLFSGNIVLLNVDGYYNNFVEMFAMGIDEHFLKADHSALFYEAKDAEQAVKLAFCTEPQHFSSKL